MSFRDGNFLSGDIVDQEIVLHTVHNTLKIPTTSIRVISRNSSPHQLVTLITYRHETFTGYISSSTLNFKPALLAPISISLSEIDKITFNNKPDSYRDTDQTRWVSLMNGNQFRARVVSDVVKLGTAGGIKDIPVRNIKSYRNDDGQERKTKVVLSNDDHVSGYTTTQQIEVQIADGQNLKIPGWHIKSILREAPVLSCGLDVSTKRTCIGGLFEDMVWKQAKRINTAEEYREYISRCNPASFVREAIDRMKMVR